MAACAATSSQSGQPCRKPAIRGGTVCATHGGSAPQVRAAAARKLELEAAEQAVATYGLPIDITPGEALLAEVQWTAGHVVWLRQQIRALETGQISWGVTEERIKTGGEDAGQTTVKQAAPPVLLELYARERKHLVDVCTAALKAGVEERRVRLAEQQGDLVAQLLRDIAEDLDLTPEQQAVFAEAAPRRLRLIAGGAA